MHSLVMLNVPDRGARWRHRTTAGRWGEASNTLDYHSHPALDGVDSSPTRKGRAVFTRLAVINLLACKLMTVGAHFGAKCTPERKSNAYRQA